MSSMQDAISVDMRLLLAGTHTETLKFKCRSCVRYAFPSSRPIRPVTIDHCTGSPLFGHLRRRRHCNHESAFLTSSAE
ncbi:hypothetical protein KC328_g51 [Hortaea werneckii]|nr:hypothetical protein KC328_g51 [Hortaea werneckii]